MNTKGVIKISSDLKLTKCGVPQGTIIKSWALTGFMVIKNYSININTSY